MAKLPTVEDVARVSGVSRQTVSNVLNSPDIVRPATRERVEAAITELGYRPHAAARRLRTRRSSTIGVHLDPYAGGISGVVLDRFVHALTESANERAVRVLVYAARSQDDEIARLRELTEAGEIDATVISGTFHGDQRTTWLAEHGIPFVTFGRPWPEGDEPLPSHRWIDVDGAAGTLAATRHAISTSGPRVAFLGWPSPSGTGDDRERGWREAMTGAGAQGPRLTSEDSVTAANAAMAVSLARNDVDAVVCASDSLAIGAHLAAVDAGTPGLLIIGFDNTPAAEALGLSSVEQLPEDVASAALNLLYGPEGNLVSRPEPSPNPAHLLVQPRLIIRTPIHVLKPDTLRD